MVVIITGLFLFLTLVAGISQSETTVYRLRADTDQTAASAGEPVVLENDQRSFKIIVGPCSTCGDILFADWLLAVGIAPSSQNRSPKFKLHRILRI